LERIVWSSSHGMIDIAPPSRQCTLTRRSWPISTARSIEVRAIRKFDRYRLALRDHGVSR
jgi:hypothetical protein